MTQASGNNFWSNLTTYFGNWGRQVGGYEPPKPVVDYTPAIIVGGVVTIVAVLVLTRK